MALDCKIDAADRLSCMRKGRPRREEAARYAKRTRLGGLEAVSAGAATPACAFGSYGCSEITARHRGNLEAGPGTRRGNLRVPAAKLCAGTREARASADRSCLLADEISALSAPSFQGGGTRNRAPRCPEARGGPCRRKMPETNFDYFLTPDPLITYWNYGCFSSTGLTATSDQGWGNEQGI